MDVKEYYLGLDIGTNSVGWAVTDTNYNLLKLKGKSAWGVRLFDEANSCAERRVYRQNRRRKNRKKWRLELIRQLFEKEINKIDDSFYLRMKDSPLFREDKNIDSKYVLFNDKNFKDFDYFKKYPTIYHLRKELMESDEPKDIRLVFLAIYHIVKNRGHFLWSNISEIGENIDVKFCLKILFESINDRFIDISDFDLLSKIDDIEKIIKSDKTKNDKKYEIKGIFKSVEIDDKVKNRIQDILYMVIGTKIKVVKLIDSVDDSFDDESNESVKEEIEFESDKYEEQMEKVKSFLDDKMIQIIINAKTVYDSIKLDKIIGNEKTISNAKVKDYEKHKKDLKELKRIVKENIPDKYDEMFRNDIENNYVSYSGKNIIGSNRKYMKQCRKAAFYDYIKKALKDINDPVIQIINEDIEKSKFLPLERWSDNSVIPNTLHRYELERILENAKKYLSFLSEKDDSGKTISDKILDTFDFRIPYYIGPLNVYHKNKSNERKGAWLTFKENKGKLYPWNYLDQIDQEKTAEDFILRMTNKCTYLTQYDVLPKNSLIYQEFMLLNEINIIKINDERLNENHKKAIFEYFKLHKKVTLKNIIGCLESNGFYNKGDITEDNFTGVNKNKGIINSLSTYHRFKEFFGKDIEKDAIRDIVDNIVKYLTIYNDGGEIVKERINKEYGEKLKTIFSDKYDEYIKKISKLKFSGWGSLSRELLTLQGMYFKTGEKDTVINFLRQYSLSLMEVIATDDFDFIEIIEKNQREQIKKLTYNNLVQDLYVSPSVKKEIWQALKIVKELKKVIGYAPTKIFIEMARADEEKKETISRKDSLKILYDNLKDDEYSDLKEKLNNETNDSLRRKDLFLYYTQLGRDMYTGKSINLDDLKNNLYNIDHIFPRAQSGQDSITKNLVLVNSKDNLRKSDDYPLPKDIQENMSKFWSMLKQLNFITAEKYNRLIRKTNFTDDELAGFIDKQLVETRQSTKAVKDVLKNYLKNESKIISVHANLVSKFRNGENMKKDSHGETKKYPSFLKVRSINDFHHAKDAYLNIVVGNVYNTKFTDNPKKWIQNEKNNTKIEKGLYNLYWMFSKDIKGAWISGENGTIKTVENIINRNDILVTVQQYEIKGNLYDETKYPSLLHRSLEDSGTKAKISLKNNPPYNDKNKYGGYSAVTPCYFVIYKYDEIELTKSKNGNSNEKISEKYCIDTVPLMDVLKIRNSKEYLLAIDKIKYEDKQVESIIYKNLCAEYEEKSNKKTYSIENFKLVKNRILKNSLISVNGYKYYLRGNNENNILLGSAEQLILSNEIEKYIKKIEKIINESKDKKEYKINDKIGITTIDNIKLYDILLEKMDKSIYKNRSANQFEALSKKREKFIDLDLYQQCKILNEIIKNFSCKVTNKSNLELLGLGKNVGQNLTISKNIDILKTQIRLFEISTTGLFNKMVDLNGLANC